MYECVNSECVSVLVCVCGELLARGCAVPLPGVVYRCECESGDAVSLQEIREKSLHLAVVIAAPLLQFHRYLLQFELNVHLIFKLPLLVCGVVCVCVCGVCVVCVCVCGCVCGVREREID